MFRALLALLGAFALLSGTASATPQLGPEDLIGAAAGILDYSVPSTFYSGASGPGGNKKFLKENTEFNVILTGTGQFTTQALSKYVAWRSSQGLTTACDEIDTGLGICNTAPPQAGQTRWIFVNSRGGFYIKTYYTTAGAYSYMATWCNRNDNPSPGTNTQTGANLDNWLISQYNSCYSLIGNTDKSQYMRRTDANITNVASYTAIAYNDEIVKRIMIGINFAKPNVNDLTAPSSWGMSYNALGLFEVKPWSCSTSIDYSGRCTGTVADPGGTGGTGGTGTTTPPPATSCTSTTGTQTYNQYECAPVDTEANCKVLDLICWSKWAFIPSPDFFGTLFSAPSVTQQLNLPVVVTDYWEFDLMGQHVKFDWRTIVIPQEVQDFILAMLWIRQGVYAMAFLGMPLPFGAHGAGGADIGQAGVGAAAGVGRSALAAARKPKSAPMSRVAARKAARGK